MEKRRRTFFNLSQSLNIIANKFYWHKCARIELAALVKINRRKQYPSRGVSFHFGISESVLGSRPPSFLCRFGRIVSFKSSTVRLDTCARALSSPPPHTHKSPRDKSGAEGLWDISKPEIGAVTDERWTSGTLAECRSNRQTFLPKFRRSLSSRNSQ